MTSHTDIALLLFAFQHRQPDAMERAVRLREHIAQEIARATKAINLAEAAHNKALEDPAQFRLRRNGDIIVPLEAAPGYLDTMINATVRRERALDRMMSVNEIIAEYGRRNLGDEAEGATTELLAQVKASRNTDSIARLAADDRITMDQLRDAREIASVFYHVARGQYARTMPYPVKDEPQEDAKGRRFSSIETAEWMALLHSFVYLPWADRQRKYMTLLVAVMVEGEALRTAAARHRVGFNSAVEIIKDALDAYSKIRRRYLKAGADATERLPIPGERAPVSAATT